MAFVSFKQALSELESLTRTFATMGATADSEVGTGLLNLAIGQRLKILTTKLIDIEMANNGPCWLESVSRIRKNMAANGTDLEQVNVIMRTLISFICFKTEKVRKVKIVAECC